MGTLPTAKSTNKSIYESPDDSRGDSLDKSAEPQSLETSAMAQATVADDVDSSESCLLHCSQVLASAEIDDRHSIESALRAVIAATRFDRVRVIENLTGTGSARYAQLTCEVGDGADSSSENALRFDYENDCEGWNPVFIGDSEPTGEVLALPASLQEKLKAGDVHEMLAFPLFSGREWIGIITFEQLQENGSWRKGETALLKAVVGMLGSHLGRRQAITSLRRQVRLQSVLSEVATRLAQTRSASISTEIDLSLEALGKVSDVDRVSVFRVDYESSTASSLHEWCAPGIEPQIAHSQAFSLREELPWLSQRLSSAQPIDLTDIIRLGTDAINESLWFRARGAKSALITPLVVDNRTYGFACIEKIHRSKVWGRELVSALHVFCELIVGALRRRESDEELRTSEFRYRLIADNASDMIAIHNSDNSFAWVSPSLEEIIGKTFSDIKGKDLREFVHQDDIDALQKLQALTLQGASGERTGIRLRSHSGEWLWVGIIGKPIVSQVTGAVEQYIIIARSIEHRRRAEDSLKSNLHFTQSLLNSLPDPVYFKDRSLRYRMVNNAFERFVGINHRNILGKSIEEVWPGEEAAQYTDMDKSLLLKPGTQTYEAISTKGDGSKANVLINRASLTNRDGEVTGIVGVVRDISERRRSEDSLRELEARQKQILNAITDIVIVKSNDSRITWANSAFLDYYDMTEDDLSDFIDASFNDDSITEKYLEADRKVVESGRVLTIDEEPITRHDGVVRYFSTVKSPIFDTSGKVSSLVAVCRDITNSKITERALEESNRLFMTLIGNLPGMVYRCRTDDERTLEYVSNGCINLTGHTPSDLTDNRRVTFTSLIHPEDRSKVRKALKRAIEDRSVYQVSYRIVSADGHIRWVWEQGAVETLSNSDELCLEGLILNVTDRKLEEERRVRLATAVEQVAELIMITDLNGVIEYVNPGFTQVTGYSCDEALEREHCFLSRDLHDAEYFDKLWSTVHGGRVWKGRLKNRHKEGRIVECDATISPVRDASGRITNFVAVERDVTEMVNLETQLRQAQKLEAVGSLAAGIAHEINTPIQFVGDNTHFLADAFKEISTVLETARTFVSATQLHDKCPAECSNLRQSIAKCDLTFYQAEVPTAIDQTLQGIDRVATIVRAMKDFSHPDTREKSAIEINKALSTTLTVARNELKYVADIVTEFQEDLPIVMGYPGELNQVFLNLLVNAAHAVARVVGDGSSGKGKIIVRTHVENDNVVVEVEDSGCGIKPEDRDRIFDPFFTTKAVGKGTGQGLAIARSVVVDKHGGTIEFISEIGKGATFFVRLPLAAEGNTI